jgi:choline dehydrogenase-like flavoprotein
MGCRSLIRRASTASGSPLSSPIAIGNPGWSWDDVLPYCKTAKNWEGEAGEVHGKDGPLFILPMDRSSPLCAAVIAGGRYSRLRGIRGRARGDPVGRAVGSPHILQLSGVGAPEHPGRVGIAVHHDLPGVGQNLRDHYIARISYAVQGVATVNERSHGIPLAAEVLSYLVTAKGILTYSASLAAASVKVLEDRRL